MGLFALNLEEPTKDNLLKVIRSNLTLYEEHGGAYLLETFTLGYLQELIKLEKENNETI